MFYHVLKLVFLSVCQFFLAKSEVSNGFLEKKKEQMKMTYPEMILKGFNQNVNVFSYIFLMIRKSLQHNIKQVSLLAALYTVRKKKR